jgi:uncharacterized protein
MPPRREPEFIRIQRRFGEFLRARQAGEPPFGIEARRMQVYRNLVRGNIRGAVERGFPVMRTTLGEEAFGRLVEDFIAEHQARVPQYPELGGEFARYLADGRESHEDDPPWLAELADYEWLEVEVGRADRSLREPVRPEGDLIESLPVISPEAALREYRWPVHRIGPESLPERPPEQPTCLAVYRDEQGRVRFHQLAPLLLALLQAFRKATVSSTREALAYFSGETGIEIRVLIEKAQPALAELQRCGVIRGVRQDRGNFDRKPSGA